MKRSDIGLRMLVLAAGLVYAANTFGQAPKSTAATAGQEAATEGNGATEGDGATEGAGQGEDTKSAKSAKSASVKGRLPRYFGQLMLDEGQRSTIYSIQQKYRARLGALQQQLDKLRAEQGQEIQHVLSATQQQKLSTLLSRPPKRASRGKKGAGGKQPTAETPNAGAGQVTTTP